MQRSGIIILLLVGACAGKPPARLQTGRAAVSPEWQPMTMEGASVALHHRDGAALSASVSCDKGDDRASLDVLTNHLLMELESRKEVSRIPTEIDGRAALRTRLSAKLEGVLVELDLVVLKKDGCVVDAQLVSPPDQLAARQVDFEHFIAGLAMLKRDK